MSLLMDLYAFYLKHQRCGDLAAGVSDGEAGWVVMTCSCGAQLARQILSNSENER
jgi:hypothetical protein